MQWTMRVFLMTIGELDFMVYGSTKMNCVYSVHIIPSLNVPTRVDFQAEKVCRFVYLKSVVEYYFRSSGNIRRKRASLFIFYFLTPIAVIEVLPRLLAQLYSRVATYRCIEDSQT